MTVGTIHGKNSMFLRVNVGDASNGSLCRCCFILRCRGLPFAAAQHRGRGKQGRCEQDDRWAQECGRRGICRLHAVTGFPPINKKTSPARAGRRLPVVGLMITSFQERSRLASLLHSLQETRLHARSLSPTARSIGVNARLLGGPPIRTWSSTVWSGQTQRARKGRTSPLPTVLHLRTARAASPHSACRSRTRK